MLACCNLHASLEGKRKMKSESQSQSNILLTKIREFTRALLFDLTSGRSPLILIDRFRNHCTNPSSNNCFCGSGLPCGKEALTLCKGSHVHRIDVMLKVLLIVQKLLQENKHSSKRDIYYMHPSVFLDQSVVDRSINDICVIMQCSRHDLNVVPAGKGYKRRSYTRSWKFHFSVIPFIFSFFDGVIPFI